MSVVTILSKIDRNDCKKVTCIQWLGNAEVSFLSWENGVTCEMKLLPCLNVALRETIGAAVCIVTEAFNVRTLERKLVARLMGIRPSVVQAVPGRFYWYFGKGHPLCLERLANKCHLETQLYLLCKSVLLPVSCMFRLKMTMRLCEIWQWTRHDA